MDKLKECPFCGSANVEVDDSTNRLTIFVWCVDCSTEGPVWTTVDDAVQAWNTRAALAQQNTRSSATVPPDTKPLNFVIWPSVLETGVIPPDYCRELAVADALMGWSLAGSGNALPENFGKGMALLSVTYNFSASPLTISQVGDEILAELETEDQHVENLDLPGCVGKS